MSALGACATSEAANVAPHNFAASADLHAISVNQTGERIVRAGRHRRHGDLAAERAAEIGAFASNYLRDGHGALIMSTPSGSGNANSAGLMAHQTRMALTESGVPYAAISGSTYDASGSATAPIVLSFTRFEATAPRCAPIYEQDLAHQINNQPWASFGCATQSNLAAMVEDPRDLLFPRDEAPRDSERRTTVLDAYRQGDQTHAERSDDERVTVSNAVGN